jgi:hypothetical protein
MCIIIRLLLGFWNLSNMDSSFSYLEVLNSKDHLVTTAQLFFCSVDIKLCSDLYFVDGASRHRFLLITNSMHFTNIYI